MIASGVAAVSYAAAGDKKAALMACAGIGLAAVGAGAAVTLFKAAKIAKAAKAGQELAKFKPVGSLTSKLAGRMYVGKGASMVKGHLVSADGLRGFRPPALKQTGPLKGTYASNFEKFATRPSSSNSFKYSNRYYNSHLRRR
ncbi:MAG TPA: hypothetical protein VLI54_00910 [Bacillota bacterium]|nr:hypothetical protein [Bacillota bacterium]